MKKEELRERAKNRSRTMRTAKGTYYNAIPMSELNLLIDQLDEPEKVVIPQFVAVYIRFSKKGEHSPRISMDEAHISKELNDWLAKTEDYTYYPNQEKFMRAWLDGYVIEKEQLYYVVIPTDDLNWKYYYLDNDGGIDMTDEKLSITHHTESFIRSVSDELWQFAVEVEE